MEDVQVIDIPLTQAEQALIYLHRLWDTKHFKTDQTSIEKDTRYLLTIQVHADKGSGKTVVQNNIKEQLKNRRVFTRHLSLADREITFLSAEDVWKYVDGEMNYSQSNISCVWYLDKNSHTITVYAKSEYYATSGLQTIRNAIISGRHSVPENYFATKAAKESLSKSNLSSRYGQKLGVWLDPSSTTLHFIQRTNNTIFKRT